jgi:hypothetical protein
MGLEGGSDTVGIDFPFPHPLGFERGRAGA